MDIDYIVITHLYNVMSNFIFITFIRICQVLVLFRNITIFTLCVKTIITIGYSIVITFLNFVRRRENYYDIEIYDINKNKNIVFSFYNV